MSILVIAEHDNNVILPATLNCLMAAAQISLFTDSQVHLLVMGHNAERAVDAAAHFPGVSTVLHANGPQLVQTQAENLTTQVVAVAGSYSHILFAATASGMEVALRAAAQLEVDCIADITSVHDAVTFGRPIPPRDALACVQSVGAIRVITVRASAFDAATAIGGAATVKALHAAPAQANVTLFESEIAACDRPALNATRVVIPDGQVLAPSEMFTELITQLSDKPDTAQCRTTTV